MSSRRRVLLLVARRRNRELLREWLSQDPTLEPVEEADGADADLVIVDAPALADTREWLRRLRERALPAYLPILLATPHREVTMLTAELWRDVDEVITTPIRMGELRVRIERLLMIRAHSLETARRLAELGRSNTDLQQFAFVAAHELATPLAVVSGTLETVLLRFREGVAPEVATLLEQAHGASKRLRRLIEDLLAYSQAGHRATLAPVDLAALVPEALEPLQPQIDATGAEVRVDELPVALADAAQLRLVFSNLVANALKYRSGGAPPRVRISAAELDGATCVSVEDNGIGIAASRSSAVFEMFEREPDAAPRPGAGIGLALCRRILERHGGEIWVEPVDGGGSAFRFTLRRP